MKVGGFHSFLIILGTFQTGSEDCAVLVLEVGAHLPQASLQASAYTPSPEEKASFCQEVSVLDCGFLAKKVVFSDEKVFRGRPGGYVRRWVPNSASKFDARYTGAAVSKPQGLMVYDSMPRRI